MNTNLLSGAPASFPKRNTNGPENGSDMSCSLSIRLEESQVSNLDSSNLSFSQVKGPHKVSSNESAGSSVYEVLSLYKEKIRVLEAKLADSQTYLHYILHDLKSPVCEIKVGLETTLEKIKTTQDDTGKELQ